MTTSEILDVLGGVIHPAFDKSITELGLVEDVKVEPLKDAVGNDIPDSYKVNFSQMLATDMRTDVTAKICCNGVVTSNTLLYSVESYVASKLGATNTAENLANLLKMMMYYGDAAAAYFNK